MSEKDKKGVTAKVIHLGAESMQPEITEPNIPTNNQSYMTGKVINFGTNNLLPYYLANFIQISPTHLAIIDYKSKAIAGKGITVNGNPSPDGLNYTAKQYKKLIKMTSPELSVYETFAWELLTNDKGKVIQINPLPVDTIRSGDYVNGEIKEYYYRQNWKDGTTPEKTFRPWNPLKKGGKKGNFLAYTRIPRAGQYFYTIPSYYSAWRWIELEDAISEFHKNNIDSGFFPTMIIELFGGQAEDEAINKLENGIKSKFTGKGASKVVILQNDDPENKTEINSYNPPDLPNYFDGLMPEISAKIMTAHQFPPLLAGIKEKGTTGLGSNSEEIQANFALYYSTNTLPFQTMITDLVEEIHDWNGDDVTIEIEPYIPDFDYKAVKGKRNDLPETEVVEPIVEPKPEENA